MLNCQFTDTLRNLPGGRLDCAGSFPNRFNPLHSAHRSVTYDLLGKKLRPAFFQCVPLELAFSLLFLAANPDTSLGQSEPVPPRRSSEVVRHFAVRPAVRQPGAVYLAGI